MPHLAAVWFWLRLALVSPQALRVRRRALRLPAAAGPGRGDVGHGPVLRFVAVGDSIIAGVGAPTLRQALVGQVAEALAGKLGRRVTWVAEGQGGVRTRGIRDGLVPRLPAEPADIVLVSAGVNDVTGLRRTVQWRADLGSLLGALEAKYPDATIVLAGLPPLHRFPALPWPLRSVLGDRARVFDAIAAAIAARRASCLHVPTVIAADDRRFAPDGYHPSPESYQTWGRALADAIARARGDGRTPNRATKTSSNARPRSVRQ